jgi:cell division protein FtsW (lipid II flippase)
MAVSYTTAAARDAARSRAGVLTSIDPMAVALGGASIFALFLVFIAYAGVMSASRSASATVPINLNTAADASSLEPVVARVFPGSADRRLAARELFAYLVKTDAQRRIVQDVRALEHARLAAATIDGAPAALAFAARLEEERARAKASGRPAPQSVPVLTPAEATEIKPFLVVRTRSEVRRSLFLWTLLYVLAFHAVSLTWRAKQMKGDRLLLLAAHLLTALGLAAMISRVDPLRDAILFARYSQGVIAGLVIAAAVSLANLRTAFVRNLSYVPLVAAFALSVLLLVFGGGPAGSRAKVNLGPVQPIEAIRVLLALFLAGYFARNWELLRAVRADAIATVNIPRWLHLPRPRYTLPLFLGVGLALLLFFIQRDLGPALMLSVVFLAAYAIARGRIGLVMVGALLLTAGFYLGYRLGISSTLVDRVRMWQSPWENDAHGGSQIAHALWAMASGGRFGAGVGLGDTGYIPAGYTDLVLASIGEELGFAGLIGVGLIYVAMIARALATARQASTDYGFFLATMLALFLAVPVLLMAAGILGVVPLTGVVTPFLSYGGSAMVANFAALGLLASIRSDATAGADLSIFRAPVRWVSAAMSVAAVVLVFVAARVQVTQADALVVRPHLGVQGDGIRRYQDNPRIVDVVRRIPRGTIVDRNGLALATDSADLIKKAAPAYARVGISVASACPPGDAGDRCYPLGGRAFHLLGDARTRRNWSASNSSFVERDAEAKLRGFDDHAAVVAVTEPDGTEGSAVRRDYRDVVPLLRHRYEPDHPAVKAAMGGERVLRLTIDARLQARVAAILGDYARKSASGHAAAVVIDPATGDLLASVSYPWPSDLDSPQTTQASTADLEPLLDRARYGLYPPGSTFKLITAAAALRRDAAAGAQTFTCRRLPDDRVGAKLPGYARPVRDDEMDKTPHGTIDLHRALVVSCNAYFAQLAVHLGPQALVDAAQPAEIALARNNAIPRIRDTLPQVGYGQGDVLVSPLRLARIAAAIASDGTIRETRVDAGAALPAARRFVPPETAHTLARAMRDVVLEGTGRSLRANPVPIAGKTGTAEITGKPSHSWFIGFAPYGPSAHRVAVAVILENAGYGGAAAAPAAGEIIAAASALGLAR